MKHTVDSTHHPRGENALWQEVCRLRRLLRDGERLMGELESNEPERKWLHADIRHWREAAGRELG